MKEKKKYTIDLPLKRINWSKIHTRELKENSFWVKANDEKFASEDLFKVLIDNFSTKPTKVISDEISLKKKVGPVKELKYLNAKQANNICKTTFKKIENCRD